MCLSHEDAIFTPLGASNALLIKAGRPTQLYQGVFSGTTRGWPVSGDGKCHAADVHMQARNATAFSGEQPGHAAREQSPAHCCMQAGLARCIATQHPPADCARSSGGVLWAGAVGKANLSHVTRTHSIPEITNAAGKKDQQARHGILFKTSARVIMG